MTKWMFSDNVPVVMNNFFYFVFIALVIIAVAFGIYAAKAAKNAEQYMPTDPEFEAWKAEKEAEKAAKKAAH